MNGAGRDRSRPPAGALLGVVLRLLLPADRRQEFLGDLLEEANVRGAGSPSEVAFWLWTQTLRSAPALLGLRLRRFAVRAQPVSAGAGAAAPPPRTDHGGWPLSLALSLGAHGLLVVGAVTWILSRVEEVTPPPLVDVWAVSRAPGPELPALADAALLALPPPRDEPQSRPARAPARRPSPGAIAGGAAEGAPVAALAPAPEGMRPEPVTADGSGTLRPASTPADHQRAPRPAAGVTQGAAAAGRASAGGRVPLPPRVAEKRCLSCPVPRLPPAFARLGAEQAMRVKTCVNASGQVTSVDVLSASDPMINARVIDTVRGWHLVPYSVDGRPVPFCYATSFVFASR